MAGWREEALTFRRDRARDRHTFGDDIAELLERTVQEESGTLERERSALEVCVGKLPPDQCELVRMAYESGVKINDLARELGCTAMALYKKLHRIRLALLSESVRSELRTLAYAGTIGRAAGRRHRLLAHGSPEHLYKARFDEFRAERCGCLTRGTGRERVDGQVVAEHIGYRTRFPSVHISLGGGQGMSWT